MERIETGIEGLCVMRPRVFEDERGYFFEAHNAEKLAELGVEPGIVQMNHSFSKKGVLRGLHFQAPPHDQTKLVRCVAGRLYDVAVDIRKGSPTYGAWFGVELSAENRKMLFVPSGFAHGFYAVTDCELLYAVGLHGYDKASEGGLRWDAPEVGIDWPFDACPGPGPGGAPNANERDLEFPTLDELETPFTYEKEIAV